MRNFLAIYLFPKSIYDRCNTTSVGQALTFAIGTSTLFNFIAWLLASLERAFRINFGIAILGTFHKPVLDFVKISKATGFLSNLDQEILVMISRIAGIILTPFATIATLAFSTFFVWLGMKVFVSPQVREVRSHYNFPTLLSLFSWGVALQFLAFIPFVGPFVLWIWNTVFVIRGIKHLYQISTFRAFCVLSFPVVAAMIVGILVVTFFGALLAGLGISLLS